MIELKKIIITQPDDWHVHLREGKMLKCVIEKTSRINKRCIAMPNLKNPIINTSLCKKYISDIKKVNASNSFLPLIPCYLTDKLDLDDFQTGIKNNIFVGAKLYPLNATTNSNYGISNLKNIYKALEILEKNNKPLLIHGEKVGNNISLFDREKYFIDDELNMIRKNFPMLRIVLEHVSSQYGADFVNESKNLFATITLHHMLLTKKDVFQKNINAYNYCMPVVKEESDLIALRKYACSGNEKFFIGTDSAPHPLEDKDGTYEIKPGIFTSPCSIELYTEIFEEEDSLNNLEKFTSINGAKFYGLPINHEKISLVKKDWILEEYTMYSDLKVKNFFGGKKIKWRVE